MVQLRIQRVGSIGSPVRIELAYRQKDGSNIYYNQQGHVISELDVQSGKASPWFLKFEKGEKSKILSIDLETGKDADKKTEDFKRYQGQVNIKNALFNHPFLAHAKNTNRGSTTIAEIIDVNEEQITSVQEIKRMKAVLDTVSDMSIEEMVNLCYYLQMPTSGQTPEQIYSGLLDRKTGIAYLNYQKVMSMSKDPKSEIVVSVNKAIHLGIIEIANGAYFYRGEAVAETLDNLYLHFLNNGQIFTMLKRQVSEKDMLPVSISNELDANKGREKMAETIDSRLVLKEEYSEDEIKELKQMAKDRNIMGWFNAKPATLVEKIAEYDRRIADKEAARSIKETHLS
jgi:hypothetical protein